MSEVNNELKWLVVEWLECKKNMVNQEITVHIQNPNTMTSQVCIIVTNACNTVTIYGFYSLQSDITYNARAPYKPCELQNMPALVHD